VPAHRKVLPHFRGIYMRKVNIHEAKIHLSRLVERAAKGKGFIITKADKPLIKVVPLSPAKRPGRVGSASLPARSSCQTTSIAWVRTTPRVPRQQVIFLVETIDLRSGQP
jgi:prevent-host-death family protein